MMGKRKTKTPREKAIRFGALVRVSTEKQADKGHSLQMQTAQIKEAVQQLGGRIAEWYGGQEHATAGWERQELDRLLADAEGKRFDATIVTHPDRWSRDNVKSETGLNLLQENGIRYFVLTTEQDLFDPTVRLYLGQSALIGSYQAALQSKKSMEVRIDRAKRGWPTCGKLPYGRTFDKETGKWGIDPEVKEVMEDVAARYLVGESMANLAREYGINHPFLHKTLTTGCGTTWEQTFRSPKLGINERIPTTIPALLEPKIIAAVRRRAEANKTFAHGHIKNKYLFSRVVFCGACGYAMSGQLNPRGHRYYRHQGRNGAAECPLPFRPWVPAEPLEEKVLGQLADLWGNPKAVEKALAKAEPNRAEIAKHRSRLERIKAELGKIQQGRERILGFVAKGTITDDQAQAQLENINDREVKLTEESERLQRQLQGTLSPAERKNIAKRYASARRRVAVRGAQDPEQMTYQQKRILVEDVFGGTTSDGRRMGIYIVPVDAAPNQRNRRWKYEIRGRIEAGGVLKDSKGTKSARHLPNKSSNYIPFALTGTTEGNGHATPR